MTYRHALLIDSSPTDTKLLKQRLLDLGWEKVTVANRTLVGLEELQTRHKLAFDIIFMDIDQPDASDIGAVKKIRALGASEPLPLIVLCNEIEDGRFLRALSAGADKYVTKEELFSEEIHNIIMIAIARHRFRYDNIL